MNRFKDKKLTTHIFITLSLSIFLSACSTMQTPFLGNRQQTPIFSPPVLTTSQDEVETVEDRQITSAPVPTTAVSPSEMAVTSIQSVKLLKSLTTIEGLRLNSTDKQNADNAEKKALNGAETGSVIKWQGSSGNYGSVVPGSIFSINGKTCRDLTHTVYMQGVPEIINGTACKDSQGRWDILS